MLKDFMKSETKWVLSLFDTKQKQYGQVDELNNFKLGALLLKGKIDLDAELESAKSYMAKHVAFLYSKDRDNILDPKISESLGDIIVYCHIMRYMISLAEEEKRIKAYGELCPPPDIKTDTNTIFSTEKSEDK